MTEASSNSPIDIVARLSRRPLALGERLELISQDLRNRDPDGAATVDRFIARLEASCAGRDAPAIGDALPTFTLPDQEGRIVMLEALLGKGPVVVVFHRGHWCPYCRMTIATLAEVQPQIPSARIIAISAEMQRFTRRIRAETGSSSDFLSDMDAAYAASIGLAISIDPAVQLLFERSGKRIPDFQGSNGWILPIPAVLVLDEYGIVRARHVDPDYRRRMEVEDMIAAVRNLSG